jgi:outer membrane protein assembly factor BamE
MTMTKYQNIIAVLLLTASLSGCAHSWYPFVYRPPVSQGNIINPNAVALLKPGMSKDQVTRLMGEPLLETPLSPDTWHYVYTLREKGKLVQQKQLTLYFSGNSLVRIVL